MRSQEKSTHSDKKNAFRTTLLIDWWIRIKALIFFIDWYIYLIYFWVLVANWNNITIRIIVLYHECLYYHSWCYFLRGELFGCKSVEGYSYPAIFVRHINPRHICMISSTSASNSWPYIHRSDPVEHELLQQVLLISFRAATAHFIFSN